MDRFRLWNLQCVIVSGTMSGNGFKKPSCWNDKERRTALFAPFRNRNLNPEHYDNKMEFWQKLIAEYGRFKGEATFSKLELLHAFSEDQQAPNCLDTVIEEMLRIKEVRLLADYEYDPANSWSGWMINQFVRKPIFWGINGLKASLERLKSSTSSIIGDMLNRKSLYNAQIDKNVNIVYIHLGVMKVCQIYIIFNR